MFFVYNLKFVQHKNYRKFYTLTHKYHFYCYNRNNFYKSMKRFFPLVSWNKNDEQGMIYTALWKTQLLHKYNSDSLVISGFFIILNLTRASISLNFFGYCVIRSIFVIIYFLKFSICSVFNAIFTFVERKLIIRIVSSSESKNIFVIAFVFPLLK